jgi:hypothetical protein
MRRSSLVLILLSANICSKLCRCLEILACFSVIQDATSGQRRATRPDSYCILIAGKIKLDTIARNFL